MAKKQNENMFAKTKKHMDTIEGDLFQTNLTKVFFESISVDETQIRKKFDENAINELAESIKKYGLLNPLLVEYNATTGLFNLVAGERRYLACKQLGMMKIPVHVISTTQDNKKVIQLEENIRRVDLTLYEKSVAIFEILQEYFNEKLTPEKNVDNILSKLIKIRDKLATLSVKEHQIKEHQEKHEIEQKIGMPLNSIIYLLYPLSLNIDHIKYMHENKIPIRVFVMFVSVKDDKEFIESCLDAYIQEKVTINQLKKLIEDKKSKKTKKTKTEQKKQIRAVKLFSSLHKKTREFYDLLSADTPTVVRDKEKIKEEISKLKNLLSEIEEKL